MQILVTGLHRSGTSATARLLATMTHLQLLDDPQWAIFHPNMAKAYRQVSDYHQELAQAEIVKCPRMGECLDCILEDFPQTQIVYLVRDPRDVYCSIAEAQKSSDPTVTTMADNQRFGPHESLWHGVSLAFCTYAQQALQAINGVPERLTLIDYVEIYQTPQQTLQGLCQHLGLPIRTSDIASAARQQLGPTRNKHQSDLSIKGAHRWQQELDPAEAASIVELCDDDYRTLLAHCRSFA
ncbi:sulfotransferase family protein [Acaryochloris marina]|uniref:Sulfotransferase n=1 Tax=Acaryochloris marina (strain MBIC 11017) TaxID=329726 RepID=B0C7U5_ACAM1|nr:sulfotransferase [Acaryochloris marina]ABW26486.1 hypothetical protein AM1_1458 [Acaryochloris marina MBIC11017]BDM81297.1 hypothetical protein AM10699_41640 [Acaryochloris marina MBIC10699]